VKTLRPMLATHAPEDLESLRFPLIASPKLDGLRAIIKDGIVLSRTLKPIRNRHVQRLLGKPEFNGLDGELIVGSPTDPNCMQHTTSGVMSFDGEPDVKYYIFDDWRGPKEAFVQRRNRLLNEVDWKNSILVNHHHEYVMTVTGLEVLEESILSGGYEGLILRDPLGPYKFGRSTLREGFMLKLKRFAQDEAVVIGTEELMHNLNEAEMDERGYTKRSTAAANKIGSGKLGALVCRLLLDGQPTEIIFKIGTGLSDNDRIQLWRVREQLPGRISTFKHFKQTGVLNAPRHPVFHSFRAREDL